MKYYPRETTLTWTGENGETHTERASDFVTMPFWYFQRITDYIIDAEAAQEWAKNTGK